MLPVVVQQGYPRLLVFVLIFFLNVLVTLFLVLLFIIVLLVIRVVVVWLLLVLLFIFFLCNGDDVEFFWLAHIEFEQRVLWHISLSQCRIYSGGIGTPSNQHFARRPHKLLIRPLSLSSRLL